MQDLDHKSNELTNQIDDSLINIIVLDCCRAPLPTAAAHAPAGGPVTGIRNVTLLDHGRCFIAYPVDSERSASHGNFTRCLLQQLQAPGRHLEQIFQQVGKQMGADHVHQYVRQQTSLRMDLVLLQGE